MIATAGPSTRFKIAIAGASGYGGAEMLRWIAVHPNLEACAVTSRRNQGRAVPEVHPNLAGFHDDLNFVGNVDDMLATEPQAVVLAVPHKTAADMALKVQTALPDVPIVDLSGDHRLDDPDSYRAHYGVTHPHPGALTSGEWVYGLSEANRDRICNARLIANPGCYATGAALAALPLSEEGLIAGPVRHVAITGSSGGGVEARRGTHHPERVENVRAYKVLAHQHVPEIVRCLREHGMGDHAWHMVPQSGPFARGILTTLFVELTREMTGDELRGIYDGAFENEPFVRMRDGSPQIAHVHGTNFCDIAVHVDGKQAVVLSAIDNLGKGMAGQAVQNLNLLLGLNEAAGIAVPGSRP